MRKIVLTFGLIAGGILSVMMLVSALFIDRLGFDRGAVIGYTTMVLAFLLVYFGIRSYRDTIGGGRIGFGRAMAVGASITLVASACYVATWQVVYYRINPDFVERYAAHTLEKERRAGATPQQLAAKQQEMARFAELYENPLINAGITLIEVVPIGLVMTLVSAGVLRDRPSRRAPITALGAASTT